MTVPERLSAALADRYRIERPTSTARSVRDKLNRETQLGIEPAVKITTEVVDALDLRRVG